MRPDFERAVAEHELEVLREQERRREQRELRERDRRRRGREPRVPEELHVEHRLGVCGAPTRRTAPRNTRRRRSRRARSATVQPRSGASMIAVRAGRQADDRQHRADRVERALVGRVEFGNEPAEPTSARARRPGTLTRNTDAPAEVLDQQAADQRAERDADAGRRPPRRRWRGPRSLGSWNVLVMIDSVVGKMNAAPMPMSPRATMSIVGRRRRRRERREDAEPRRARTCSALRRPYRSPSAPAVSSRHANTIVYASTIHCSSEPVAPRSRTIVGQRDVEDRVVDPDDDERTATARPSVHHRRSYARSALI